MASLTASTSAYAAAHWPGAWRRAASICWERCMEVSIASAERRLWDVSASAARLCPPDQWRAKRRWPSQHTTSQPSTHHGMALAVSAAGRSVWGWAGQARVGQCARLQTRCRGPVSVHTR
jgi:hypothetical protein